MCPGLQVAVFGIFAFAVVSQQGCLPFGARYGADKNVFVDLAPAF